MPIVDITQAQLSELGQAGEATQCWHCHMGWGLSWGQYNWSLHHEVHMVLQIGLGVWCCSGKLQYSAP